MTMSGMVQPTRRYRRHFLLWVCLSSLALRLVIVFLSANRVDSFSQVDHYELASNVANGLGYTFRGMPSSYFGPTYTYLWAFFLSVWGTDGHLWLQVLQSLLLSVSPLLLYSFARLRFDRETSLLAAVWLALYPELLVLSSTMYPSSLLVFLWCANLACYAALRRLGRPTAGWVLLTGLVAALLVLTKGRMLVFSMLLTIALAFPPEQSASGRLPFRVAVPRLLQACLVLAVTLAFMAPWTVRNYFVHGRLLPLESTSGYNLWIGNNPTASGTGKCQLNVSDYDPAAVPATGGFPKPPDLEAELSRCKSEIQRDDVYKKHAVRYIKSHPGRVMSLWLKKAAYAWLLDTTNPHVRHPVYWLPWSVTFVLFMAGLGLRTWRERLREWLFWIMIICFTLLQMVFFVIPRLRYPVYPVVFIFAAYAAVRLLGRRAGGSEYA